jgi:hypothetical protein
MDISTILGLVLLTMIGIVIAHAMNTSGGR